MGKRAVVIGRSNVVGKPVQLLLMREHCTVTVCHRRTRDLPAEIARAEIVVTAAGSAGPRQRRHAPSRRARGRRRHQRRRRRASWVTSTSTSAVKVAAAITPVPGGVGPVTNAVLLEHLMRAARWQQTGHPIIAGHARKRRAA